MMYYDEQTYDEHPGIRSGHPMQLVGVHGAVASGGDVIVLGQVCGVPAAGVGVCGHGAGAQRGQHVFDSHGAYSSNGVINFNTMLSTQGIAVGAPVTVGSFFLNNLLPVSLGNVIGGAVCVALAQSTFFKSK